MHPELVVRLPTSSGQRSKPAAWSALKRCIDIVVAIAVLTLTAPLVIVALVGIALVSGGSPIFIQERVGKDGLPFRMYKLRSMVEGAQDLQSTLQPLSEVDGPVFKMRLDPRLHALGALLRRTSIDEIPNFFNVLRGEMSVVGPRPPLPAEVATYNDRALRRLSVKPGVTCLWQVSGRSELSFDTWIELDNLYIDTWSPLGDLAIIARTIPAVVRGRGAH